MFGALPEHVYSVKPAKIIKTDRSEGFPERDTWFLGTLDQGSARCPELLGRRRWALGHPDPPRSASAQRPPSPDAAKV